MSMIKVENLTFAWPGSSDNVFENVSFQMDTDWKLGFTGRNGRGKTTFLNLLMGKQEYSGKIYSSVEFDYFPYAVENKERWTLEVLQEICPEAQEWQFRRELSYLHMEPEILWQNFGTLSGGEQTRTLLAALFLREEHFLLIDEPTNHLDLEARESVSDYLKKKKGFILVSHDRVFLDGCVDHILSLNRADIQVQAGSFSSWLTNFERQQNFERAKEEKLKGEIKRLRQAARRTSGWSEQVEASKFGTKNSGLKPDRGFVGHKSAKMMKRAKNIELRQEKAIEEKAGLLKNVEEMQTLKLISLSHHAQKLMELSEVSVNYGGKNIFQPVSFSVSPGEKVALAGRNGSGKSSILKLILGEEIPYTGTVRKASGLIISYVSQDTSGLKGRLSDFAKAHEIDESLFLAMLRKLDFERTQFEKDMEDFSEGQKKKVLIAASLCRKAHLYVWDEPLNFIDLYSRMQVERLLQEFSPTMIFVEHDRAFQEAVADRVVKIERA